MASVEEILEGRRICICAGSGGVGKTTTSAALAAGLAARGKRVAVLTIDPAKRLADSLGLEELGNEPRQVDPELFERAGVKMRGELWAMMLDAKATFDELVRKHAPDEETRDRILQNRIYRQLSNALAGSQEYMAMEKLYELHHEGRYDLLVLDTPPTRSALDFLDAPRKLASFIDSRSLRLFTAPGRLGVRALGRGSGLMLSMMERATGVHLLEDLSEFFRSFGGMSQGFRERAEAVNRLLADSRTSFVLVAAPRRDAVDEAIYFRDRLLDAGLPFGGVVVNRVHRVDEGATTRGLSDRLGHDLAQKVESNLTDQRRLAERDHASLELLHRRLGRRPMIEVPELDRDVHDLDGLWRMEDHLFGGSTTREKST
ncbi:MAG: ArsA family ATPase [Solirubrobacterales bacterium]